ncbi:gamma-glutamylcyclotransferase family protein [Haloglomus litoreum]|uniref:gamma-glutamylcyclotransferase family protein n=1 Tax=Haloglomus litoreum TaxID=3034026 RepID=UPI0023E829E1|nr:gamma-glutamylcyclotransferase family protein [Haloglomus sp. DT116]
MLVFVYGTLTDPARAREVLDGPPAYAAAAALEGWHRVDGDYPTLVPGGTCEGRLLEVQRPALHRLDAYEGVDRGLYVRVSVPFEGPGDVPAGTVETYVGDPERLDAPGSWPGEGTLAARVRASIERAAVVVRQVD